MATRGNEGLSERPGSEHSREAPLCAAASIDGDPGFHSQISFSHSSKVSYQFNQQNGGQDGDAVEGTAAAAGGDLYPKSEQPQSPSCSVSGVESSGRSFGKRISTHISQRVSEGLSHSADLHGLGFKSEIKDTAMFAMGIVQIIRALHCYPCRRAQVEVSRRAKREDAWDAYIFHIYC